MTMNGKKSITWNEKKMDFFTPGRSQKKKIANYYCCKMIILKQNKKFREAWYLKLSGSFHGLHFVLFTEVERSPIFDFPSLQSWGFLSLEVQD